MLGKLSSAVHSPTLVVWECCVGLYAGSSDSTLKVWDVSLRKLKTDLPGHADEVYCVDWALRGTHAASGSKDRLLRIWTH